MNGDGFPKRVTAADGESCTGYIGIPLQVLWRHAERDERIDRVVLAQCQRAGEIHVADEPRAGTDGDGGSGRGGEDAVRADDDAVGETNIAY